MKTWHWIFPAGFFGIGLWLGQARTGADAGDGEGQTRGAATQPAPTPQRKLKLLSKGDAAGQPPPAESELALQYDLFQRLKTATPEEMKEMLNEAAVTNNPYRRRVVREIVFEHWIQQDALAAWKFCQKYDGRRALGQFPKALARAMPDGYLDFIAKNVDSDPASQEARWATLELARWNPVAFWERADDPVFWKSVSATALDDAAKEIAHRDPAAAFAAMSKSKRNMKNEVWSEAVVTGTLADPAAVRTWADGLQEPGRSIAQKVWLRGLAQTDPARAESEAKALGVAVDDVQGLKTEILAAKIKQDPVGGVAAAAAALPAEERWSFFSNRVLPALPNAGAAQILQALEPFSQAESGEEKGRPADLNRNFALTHALENWESPEPKQDWQALQSQPQSASRDFILGKLAGQLARENPDQVLEMAKQTPAGSLQSSLAASVAGRFMELRDAAGLEKVLPLMKPRLAGEWAASFAARLVNEDHAEAAGFVQRLPAGEVQDRAMTVMSHNWAQSDPQGALAWSLQQPSAAQPRLTAAATAAWAESDTYAVSEWLGGQQPGPVRDEGVRGLLSSLAESEPSSAWVWAGTITDPAARRSALAGVFMSWSEENRPAALEALAQSQLSADDRKALVDAITDNNQ